MPVPREAVQISDPRLAQITRLKNENDALKRRLAERDRTITTLSDFRVEALARLAAQHDEITRLRAAPASASNVRRLPARTSTVGPCH